MNLNDQMIKSIARFVTLNLWVIMNHEKVMMRNWPELFGLLYLPWPGGPHHQSKK